MKILLYGFKPWGKLEKNLSKEIIKKIKQRKNLKKISFEVKFEKKQFIEILKKFKPDIILGLGVCGRGKKIRIERKARNIRKISKDGKFQKIYNKGGEEFVNLKIKSDKCAWLSYDAQWYVCNFSMYVILKNLKKTQKFAFFHIPYKYNLNKGVNYFKRIINQI